MALHKPDPRKCQSTFPFFSHYWQASCLCCSPNFSKIQQNSSNFNWQEVHSITCKDNDKCTSLCFLWLEQRYIIILPSNIVWNSSVISTYRISEEEFTCFIRTSGFGCVPHLGAKTFGWLPQEKPVMHWGQKSPIMDIANNVTDVMVHLHGLLPESNRVLLDMPGYMKRPLRH